MTDTAEEIVTFSYKMPAELHRRLRMESANTGLDMRDILNEALKAYWKTPHPAPPPKEVRQRHAALDLLFEREDDDWPKFAKIVGDILEVCARRPIAKK